MGPNWISNAKWIDYECGGYVNYEEKFYICPKCEEPVDADDWEDTEFAQKLCPLCGAVVEK